MSSRKWNRDSIRDALRRLYRQGADLAYNAMCARNQALVSAAAYHFGSYRKAVLMAGLEYDRIRKKPRWTKQKIVHALRRANRRGEDLSWRAVISRGDELSRAAMAAVHPQLFGHWNDALVAAGLKPERIARYRRWTRQTIITEIRSRIARRQGVSAGEIQQTLPGLYGAAVRIFGSYPKALAAAGLEPAAIARRREWTRRRVLEALRDFAAEHRTLSHTRLREVDSGLLRAAYKFFGSLVAARKKVPALSANGSATTSRAIRPGRMTGPGRAKSATRPKTGLRAKVAARTSPTVRLAGKTASMNGSVQRQRRVGVNGKLDPFATASRTAGRASGRKLVRAEKRVRI